VSIFEKLRAEIEPTAVCPRCRTEHLMGDFRGEVCGWCADDLEKAEMAQNAYFCPTSGEVEISPGGGFDVCCDAPELHRPPDDFEESHL
jgi:hypothetical protein